MNDPGVYNLTIYRGDSVGFRVLLWADSELEDPVDLTGVTPKSQIRDRSGGVVVATFECVVTDPNIIDLYLTPAESAALSGGGVWDLQLTFSGETGKVRTVLTGKVRVVADVTDSDLPEPVAPELVERDCCAEVLYR